MKLLDKFRALLEHSARAARRGDPAQITEVLTKIQRIWRAHRNERNGKEHLVAQGMSEAMEGMLGVILAASESDARRSLVETRKHTLSILRVLAKQARNAQRQSSSNEKYIRMGQLAEAVGVLPQNVGGLVREMSESGLVEVMTRGQQKQVAITGIGAEFLEACSPGWQVSEGTTKEHFARLVEYVAHDSVANSSPESWGAEFLLEEKDELEDRNLSLIEAVRKLMVEDVLVSGFMRPEPDAEVYRNPHALKRRQATSLPEKIELATWIPNRSLEKCRYEN